MFKDITLEIIATHPKEVKDIAKLGAHRVELCDKLELGGITPPVAWIEEIHTLDKEYQLPLMVMIRPRGGNFVYANNEFLQMLEECKVFVEKGVEGLVFGMLNANGEINVPQVQEFISEARKFATMRGKPIELVFHRAFDETKDPYYAVEQLIELGVDRVLTSGQKPKAIEGINLITELIEKFSSQIEILPGSGITAKNACDILTVTKATQIHSSCQKDGRLCCELLVELVETIK